MNIERHHANQRMSQVVCCGPMVYLAGQVAKDPAEDTIGQTRQILARIDELLLLAGSDKSHILSTTIWLADIGGFQAMNSAWDAWVDVSHPPSRGCVEAGLARPERKVEIQLVAAKHDVHRSETGV